MLIPTRCIRDVGLFVKLVAADGTKEVCTWAVCALRRGSHPCEIVWAMCDRRGDVLCVHSRKGAISFNTSHGWLQLILAANPALTKLSLFPLVTCAVSGNGNLLNWQVVEERAEVQLAGPGAVEEVAAEIPEVAPGPADAVVDLDDAEAAARAVMRQGFVGLDALFPNASWASGLPEPVPVPLPKGKAGKIDKKADSDRSSSGDSSDTTDSSSRSSGGCVKGLGRDMVGMLGVKSLLEQAQAKKKLSDRTKPPAGDGGEAEGEAGGGGGGGGAGGLHDVPRQRRGQAWGPFQIAPIMSHGLQVGWGATCNRHVDLDDRPGTRCKIQLPYGKAAPLADAECRMKVKYWCIVGLEPEIAVAAQPRKEHLKRRPRFLVPTMTEAQMDDFVRSL